jgi:glucosamine--fructose-6-phosphate aminotransferase (isomerizing)
MTDGNLLPVYAPLALRGGGRSLEQIINRGNVRLTAEAREAPDVVRRQANLLDWPVRELAARLRRSPPRLVVTCARGSSSHAALFGKGLIERHLAIPVADAAPSVVSVYRRGLRVDGQVFFAISQSGRSDDLVESAVSAKQCGALTVAVVNDTESPLAAASDVVLPLGAGEESSVAATKTFIASLAALLRLIACWSDDAAMVAAVENLPHRLSNAAELDWSKAVDALSQAKSLAVLGRGPTFAIAEEASLKLKEVCHIHAEGYSGSEFQHGPIALVSQDYPVLILMPNDEARQELSRLATDLCHKSRLVFVTGDAIGDAKRLSALAPEQPDADAICLIQTFYGFAARLADRLGLDAGQPRHLQKITRTR